MLTSLFSLFYVTGECASLAGYVFLGFSPTKNKRTFKWKQTARANSSNTGISK